MSIYALKLCHDGFQGHLTSRGGRSRRRTNRLHTWLLRSKLGLTPSNRIGVDITHGGEIRRIKNGDRKIVKDPCDNRRKDELITGRRILIDIKDRSDEVRREVNRKILLEG